MAGADHDVSVLNSLITTTIDSANGFADAAEEAQGAQFKSMFQQFASERRECVGQLQQAVRSMGGEPNDDGSTLAAAHRGWMDLKNAVTGNSDKQVIEEVERGEDYIKDKYETALNDNELTAQARQVIENAYQSVRAGHDRASQLKHGMQGDQTA